MVSRISIIVVMSWLMVAQLYAVEFRPRVSYPVTGTALGMAHGDFDGDGFQDMVVGNNGRLIISAFYGQANGLLGLENVINMPSDAPDVFVSGDFDGDGLGDLAFGEGRDIAVMYGNPSRTFRDFTLYPTGFAATDMDAADLDGDGILDLVKVFRNSNALSVLYGRPDGTFEDSVFHRVGSRPEGIAIADYDKDGFGDIAITNNDNGSFSILHGTGQRNQFVTMDHATDTTRPSALVTDDFNMDTIPDLAYLAAPSDAIEIALGLELGGFANHFTSSITDSPTGLASGDLNADGLFDLVTSDGNGSQITVHIGNGDGTFTRQVNLGASANGFSRIELVDLNGDGFDDIAVTAASGSFLDVFYTVPEPASASLLVVGGLAVLRRRAC